MAEQMKSKAHVLALYRAAKDLGIDATQLTAENPFSKSGSTAAMIQEVIQQNDAVLAAEMRQAAGIGPNLAAVAQMMSGGEIDDAARQELIKTDPKFAQSEIDKAQAVDAEFMKGMEKASENLRMNRFMQQAGGNEQRARHLLQQEDAANAIQQQKMQNAGITFGRAN